MERPIIIWLKDNGEITKDVLEEAVKKAYEQGYVDGKSSVWAINAPFTYPSTPNWSITTNPANVRTEWTCSDSLDPAPTYFG